MEPASWSIVPKQSSKFRDTDTFMNGRKRQVSTDSCQSTSSWTHSKNTMRFLRQRGRSVVITTVLLQVKRKVRQQIPVGSLQADIKRAFRNVEAGLGAKLEYESVESHQDKLKLWFQLWSLEQQLT